LSKNFSVSLILLNSLVFEFFEFLYIFSASDAIFGNSFGYSLHILLDNSKTILLNISISSLDDENLAIIIGIQSQSQRVFILVNTS
jgi:hypothetical protein